MADVFISYKTERRPAAAHLAAILRAYGFNVFIDYEKLVPGKGYAAALEAKVHEARVVLVLWCRLAVQSPWVRQEAGWAKALGTYLPVWIEDASLPEEFSDDHTLALRDWSGEPISGALRPLLKAVGDKVGRAAMIRDDKGQEDLDREQAAWERYGRPPLARFSLEPGRIEPAAAAIGAAKYRFDLAALMSAPPPQPAHLRAAEAARAGRPVAERAFPIELPGVANWPNPQMIAIPPGRFLMGSAKGEEGALDAEAPLHEVKIDFGFALGKHTVTFAEWDAVLSAGAKLKQPIDHAWGRAGRPVINVSWEDAQAYIAWLNEKLGLAGGQDAYRLPSEAEWEYACRAGTTTPFSFGPTINTDQANFDGNYSYGAGKKTGLYHRKTMPVGSYPANPFGLHEMHGNVWEWCEDTIHINYDGAPRDGSAWIEPNSSSRVLRGGSWDGGPQYLRSALRGKYKPTDRSNNFGFRLARTVSPSNR